MKQRGALTTVSAGNAIALRPGEAGVATLAVAADESFVGTVVLEASIDGGATWTPFATYTGTVESPLTLAIVEAADQVHPGPGIALVRAHITALGEGSDGVSYVLTTRSPIGVEPQEVTTNDAEVTECDLTVVETKVRTSGSAGAEQLVLGDGTGVRVGTRHLVTLEALGHASDKVALDYGDILNASGAAVSAVEMDTVDQFILFEWQGTAWQIIWSAAGVTITAV